MGSWLPFHPDNASELSYEVDALYFFLVAITIFFTVGISFAIVYFSVKYRRSAVNGIPQPIAGSVKLESLWTGIPFLISMGIFVWGAKVYMDEYRMPDHAMDIYIVGKQWMWKFQHPEGQREINELHVPVGQKVRLTMATEDVIHSFYLPDFRVKQDVVPGPNRYTYLWFQPTKPGKYHIYCAEYCGTQHSGMIGWLYVMDPQDYQSWLSGGATEGSMASQGEKLFQDFGCITCHRADAQGRGPVLNGLYGKTQQLATGQTVTADDNYLRESILNPQAKIVAGFQPIMPTFQGQVSEEQLMQLVAYVKSIGSQGGAAATTGTTTPTGMTSAGSGTNPQSSNAVIKSGGSDQSTEVNTPTQPANNASQSATTAHSAAKNSAKSSTRRRK